MTIIQAIVVLAASQTITLLLLILVLLRLKKIGDEKVRDQDDPNNVPSEKQLFLGVNPTNEVRKFDQVMRMQRELRKTGMYDMWSNRDTIYVNEARRMAGLPATRDFLQEQGDKKK